MDPYPAVLARHQVGRYGGRVLRFVSLPDLIRSKETERDKDWADIETLEELLDVRRLQMVADGAEEMVNVLADLRSRRGFSLATARGGFDDDALIATAASRARYPMTLAFLLPRAVGSASLVTDRMPLDPDFVRTLTRVQFGSSKHLALVEAVRQAYRRHAKAVDRQDKQARLAVHRQASP